MNYQFHKFFDGGYVIHKMTVPDAKGWCSSWYDQDGKILDAEFFYSSNRSHSVPIPSAWADRIEACGQAIIACENATP